ncbi:MAG: hypothetical protein KKA65_04525 [Nanoarchaeota archaeon]|nr:hypothetical protein [Nanoarchaeota archaeon]MBU4456741.1 hypothetical protein [Nanoarchaeota archaeon]MCG2719173.1 hypothetical protein [Nanoarchaeota archaeon]
MKILKNLGMIVASGIMAMGCASGLLNDNNLRFNPENSNQIREEEFGKTLKHHITVYGESKDDKKVIIRQRNKETNECIWASNHPKMDTPRDQYVNKGILVQRPMEVILDKGCDMTVDAIADIIYGYVKKINLNVELAVFSRPYLEPMKKLGERARSEIPFAEEVDASLRELSKRYK